MSKPEPLTPEYCDLRGYEFMPLFGHKLFASEFYTEASADEFRAGLRLWWAAWNQVPAGSLPNSDRALATLADFGRDIEAWQDVKERALHGFIECSDGRLYHPMICAEAIESYEERLRKSKRRSDDKERLKQWREMRRNQERNASHADDTEGSETEVKRVSGAYQTEERNASVQRAARRDRDRDSNTPIVPTGDEPTLELEAEEANSGSETEGPARDFEAFWSAYPRKDGKASARKAYDRARRKIGHEAIMRAVSAWPFGENVRNGQDFRPHPASWLNGERWNDESVIHATAKPIASQYPPEVEAAHKAAKREWARTGCQGPPPMIQDFAEGARA